MGETTPVLHDSADGESTNARIDERNRLAAEVMTNDTIAVDDQYGLMMKHPELHDGDVHFTEAGYAVEAGQVAASVRAALFKTGNRE